MAQSSADILAGYYTAGAERLRQMILQPHGGTDRGRTFTRARAATLLRQVDDIGQQLKGYAAKWTGREITAQFTAGRREAEKQALVLGVRPPPGAPVAGSFAPLDRRAVEVLARDTAGDLYKAADGAVKFTKAALRKTSQAELSEADINRILAGGVIDGMPRSTWRELRDALTVAHRGNIVTVIDRNGDPMQFDAGKYARMVARTKTREAVEVGRHSKLREVGIDLVSITGRLSTNFCTAFLGQVFYIGEGDHPEYPRLDSLPGGGPPFHPNCSKSTRPYIEGLASVDQKDVAPGVADARKLIGMDPTRAQRAFRDLQLRRQVEPNVRRLTPVQPRAIPTPPTRPSPAASAAFPPEIQKEADRWAAALTTDQSEAVRRWQSQDDPAVAGYSDVNKSLRAGRPPTGHSQQWVDSVIRGMDSAIAKGKLPIDTKVFRAIRATASLVDDWKSALAERLPWTDRGFISASTNSDVMHEFHGDTKNQKVVFEFVIPAGSPAAFPAAATGRLQHQAEIVLGRGTCFEIVSIDHEADVIKVKARLLQ